MAKKSKRSLVLKQKSQIGEVAAERDLLLGSTFYPTIDYEIVSEIEDPRCFLVGRTGVGKSALIQKLIQDHPDQVIQISPQELSLQTITGGQVARFAEKHGVNIEPLYAELWKHVLVASIVRHKYGGDGSGIRWNQLLERLRLDSAREPALKYLEKYENQFWLTHDEIVRNKVSQAEEKATKEFGANLSLGPVEIDGSREKSKDAAVTTDVDTVERYKRFVGDRQLAQLESLIALLDEEVGSSGGPLFVVIDDLDRNWVDESIHKSLIMALFRTIRDLAGLSSIKAIVAVRTNLLQHLDFDSPNAEQREKYQSLFLELGWNSDDLVGMLDSRVRALVQSLGGGEEADLASILPGQSQDGESPQEFIINNTLMRPRDAISLLNKALEAPDNESVIKWTNLRKALTGYSRDRLDGLVDEWKQPYPELSWILDRFAGRPARLGRVELAEIFTDIATDSRSAESALLRDLASEIEKDEDEWFGPLVSLSGVLFDVGFLGLNLDETAPGYIYSYQNPDYGSGMRIIPSSGRFEIHRAFHSALTVKSERSSQAG